MDDDFNTPIALSVLFDLAHEIQRLRIHDMQNAATHGALLHRLGGVLGILQTDPEPFSIRSVRLIVEKIESIDCCSATSKTRKKLE